jgi:hypothetical protein
MYPDGRVANVPGEISILKQEVQIVKGEAAELKQVAEGGFFRHGFVVVVAQMDDHLKLLIKQLETQVGACVPMNLLSAVVMNFESSLHYQKLCTAGTTPVLTEQMTRLKAWLGEQVVPEGAFSVQEAHAFIKKKDARDSTSLHLYQIIVGRLILPWITLSLTAYADYKLLLGKYILFHFVAGFIKGEHPSGLISMVQLQMWGC